MEIVIMGTQHCYECQQVKKKLEEVDQAYTFVDIDQANETDQWKLQRASCEGYRGLPIIELADGKSEVPKFITQQELFTLLKGQN